MADDAPAPATPAPSRRSKATPRKDAPPTESKESGAAPSTSADAPKAKSKGKSEPEVRIPKPEQRKPRKITISAGGGEAKTIEASETTEPADAAA